MTSYEIISVILASIAILISIWSLVYAFYVHRDVKKSHSFVALNKFLIKFYDNKLPTACSRFVVPNSKPRIVNVDNAFIVDDVLSSLRKKMFDYKDLINPSTYKNIILRIEEFENAYLEFTSNQSELHYKEYETKLSMLKKELYSFVKKH